MAKVILMRHKEHGIVKKGYYGFSWTTLFFGFLPALFRGDFITFLGGFTISLILGMATLGIGWLVTSLIWAFFYNKYYTRKLVERGYVFNDTAQLNEQAALSIGVANS